MIISLQHNSNKHANRQLKLPPIDTNSLSRGGLPLGEKDGRDVIAWEIEQQNNACEFIRRLRKHKQAAYGNSLLQRKKEQQRKLKCIQQEQEQERLRLHELRNRKREEIAEKMRSHSYKHKLHTLTPLSSQPTHNLDLIKHARCPTVESESQYNIQGGRVTTGGCKRDSRGVFFGFQQAYLLREIKRKLKQLGTLSP